MIQDDEIRAAFARLADRAPHPARVQARLHRATRADRQRRALLVASGVAVGVGVAGGVVTGILREPAFGPDVRTPGNLPDPVAWPPEAGNTAVPLSYRPTWLPEGYVELERGTTVDTGPDQLRQRRAWYPEGTSPLAVHQGDPPHIYLDLAPASHLELEGWRSLVMINGARGGLGPAGSTPVLVWEAGGGLNLGLSVSGFPDNRSTALAIARSVVPDAVSTVEVALSFGWRPEIPGVVDYATGRGGSSIGLIANRREVLSVAIDRQSSDAVYETEPVTMRDGFGRWFRSAAAVIVWLTLPDGRLLQATAARSPGAAYEFPGPERSPAPNVYVSDDDMRRVIEELRIGAPPANRWIGKR